MRYRGASPQSSPRALCSKTTVSDAKVTGHIAARTLETPASCTRLQQRRSSPPTLQLKKLLPQQNPSRPSYSWWPSVLPSNNQNKKDDDNCFKNNIILLAPTLPPISTATTTTSSTSNRSSPTGPRSTSSSESSVIERHLNNSYNSHNMSSLNDTADPEAATVPKFAFREITLGALVGQGGFSDVREIITVDLEEVFDTSESETELRRNFARSVNDKGSSSSNKRFVLKTLRNDLPEEEHTKGILDLAIEADFLATLRHENIIPLRAIANTDPHESRFFVVLDRLQVTLERKFSLWRKIVGDASGIYIPCYGYCCSKSHILHNLWRERLEVALQTASAVEYLHEKGIVYRDLKPDNIGFDGADGSVKLFDFGLAKRLQDAEKAPDNGHPAFSGLYHLTGNTGSLRYMAPEVAKCLPYDQSVDAYSFGILFWQICALTTPYAKYSTKMHAERVLQKGHRPKPDSTWPPTWVQLQTSCWSTDRSFRPPFSQIVNTLREQIDEMEDGVVPSRATEIRAKKKKKRIASDALDVDTRKAAPLQDANDVQKRFDGDIV